MAFRSGGRRLKDGDRAPSFSLEDIHGVKFSLEQIRGAGPAVLAFFKISCPVCQYTFPFLERMAKGASLRFYGISQDNVKSTNGFLREQGVTFPTLLDDSAYSVSNAFGITTVPVMFLVEPDGSISWVSEGFSRQELEELGRRAGAPPFRPGEYVPEWKAG